MVRSKSTRKKKSGGYTDLYARALETQAKGCARYNELRNQDPNSDFNKCECIDATGSVVGDFEYPNKMFTCNMTEGLKILENRRDPFYRTFRDLQDKVFFSKSTEFPLQVEQEFSDLLSKNQHLSEEVGRFVIDYTLDAREHKGRVFYDTIIPDNMQTLLNNVQAIQQGIAMIANEPTLKFNDVSKLLGELITRLQDQYIKLKKLQEKHGKTLEKMDLMRAANNASQKGNKVNMLNVKRNTSYNYTSYNTTNRYYSDDLSKLIENRLQQFYKGINVKSEDKSNLKEFTSYVVGELPPLLKKAKYSYKDVKARSEDFIPRKIVELLFEKRLQIVKLLNLEILTKFIRAYLRFFLTQADTSQSKAAKISRKYRKELLQNELGITDTTQWYDSISAAIQGSEDVMPDIAELIINYLDDEPENNRRPERRINSE